MIQNYRLWAYFNQALACGLIFFALALPWHDILGNGFDVMSYAFRAEYGLYWMNGEGEITFTISPWLMFYTPLIGTLFLFLRALTGLIVGDMSHQGRFIANMGLFIAPGWTWYLFIQGGSLGWGFWSALFSSALLLFALLLEFNLPKQAYDPEWLARRFRDDPQTMQRLQTKICPRCGGVNLREAKLCRDCGFILVE